MHFMHEAQPSCTGCGYHAVLITLSCIASLFIQVFVHAIYFGTSANRASPTSPTMRALLLAAALAAAASAKKYNTTSRRIPGVLNVHIVPVSSPSLGLLRGIC